MSSSLHHRDYETILVYIRIRPQQLYSEQDLARFMMEYKDVNGNTHYRGPYYLRVNFVDMEHPVTGFSDGMVLRSGTMLHFAQALKDKNNHLYMDAPLVLRLLQDEMILPFLREALLQEDSELTATAAYILGELKDKKASTYLIEVLKRYGI